MDALLSNPRALLRRVAGHGAAGPVLVSAAYYLGAEIGFALQSPSAPQSVLWLPNSILLAVLLIVPFRRWPVYLAAAFPAQMLVAVGTGAPPLTLALLFVTNCADASLGAFLVRRLTGSHRPFVFDGLTTTVIFVAFGAMLPTVLFSFADAGISVATGWSHSYFDAFVTRARSNVLTHLIVVPAIVDMVARDCLRTRAPGVVEGTALTGLLLVICGIAFSQSPGSPAFAALLYMPLPLLLWAAFRFGPGGVGWAALIVSTVASWNVLLDRGPFFSRSPLEDVVSLQLFLLASTLPLLCLSAAIRERDRTSLAVRESESALRQSYRRVQELAGKLITAQEVERSRIARDLHDDLSQQLAALSISISTLRRGSGQPSELKDALRVLQERTVARRRPRPRSISRSASRNAPPRRARLRVAYALRRFFAAAQPRRPFQRGWSTRAASAGCHRVPVPHRAGRTAKRRHSRRGPRCHRVTDADAGSRRVDDCRPRPWIRSGRWGGAPWSRPAEHRGTCPARRRNRRDHVDARPGYRSSREGAGSDPRVEHMFGFNSRSGPPLVISHDEHWISSRGSASWNDRCPNGG